MIFGANGGIHIGIHIPAPWVAYGNRDVWIPMMFGNVWIPIMMDDMDDQGTKIWHPYWPWHLFGGSSPAIQDWFRRSQWNAGSWGAHGNVVEMSWTSLVPSMMIYDDIWWYIWIQKLRYMKWIWFLGMSENVGLIFPMIASHLKTG